MALGLIGVSWIVNSMYAYSKQLDEPIFLDHYMDVAYQDDLYMTFYYLTNKNDTSSVNSISAGEVKGYPEHPYFFDGQVQNEQTFSNHVLRSVLVKFNLDPSSQPKDYSFTEMDVFFSDGRVITAPIGHVMIHPSTTTKAPLDQIRTRGNNFNQSRYRAIRPLTIEAIEGSFPDLLQDYFFIKVNTPTTPLVAEPADEELLNLAEGEWEKTSRSGVEECSISTEVEQIRNTKCG